MEVFGRLMKQLVVCCRPLVEARRGRVEAILPQTGDVEPLASMRPAELRR
jgi:hypothetical protein